MTVKSPWFPLPARRLWLQPCDVDRIIAALDGAADRIVAAIKDLDMDNTEAFAKLQTVVDAEETALGQVVAYLSGVPALLQSAAAQAAAASGKGAPADISASLSALADKIASDTQGLVAAVQAAPTVSNAAPGNNAVEPAPAPAAPTAETDPTAPQAPALALAPAELPAAVVGVAYSQQIGVTGGTEPYRNWSLTGAQPHGLTFDATSGLLEGTPSESGSFSFTVSVIDSGNPAAAGSQAYTLTVADGPTA